MHADSVRAAIRQVLREHATIDSDALGETDDLYLAGMTSFASVNVMLALEDRFDVEFLDAMLNRTTFSTIGYIAAALHELLDREAHASERQPI
jgi:acyl carrier protein